jgi:GT2 family glycosyltransferase
MHYCSIIIPVYKKASLTRQCLDALLAFHPEGTEVEIVVVDDASGDNTQEILASYGDRIRVVTHARNTGFATSCNDGARVARGEYLVFLNNDTIPQAGWLDALARYAESHPKAGIVGSKLLFPNNTIQHAGVVICSADCCPRHIYPGFPADHPAVNKSRRFQIVTGGCMLIRRALFEHFGGFDIVFVNGFEDVDLCLRLGERGHEVHYCHESVVYHLECVTREGRPAEEDHNAQIYKRRWAHRVQPDDLRYFLEDGLLFVEHQEIYPIRFTISPLLAVVDGEERERRADRLLQARTRQVWNLLKETIRLRVRVAEAELRVPASCNGIPPSALTGPPQPKDAPRLAGTEPPEGLRARKYGAELRGAKELIRSTSTGSPGGVNVAGLFASEKGVGEGVRAMIRSLEAVDIPYLLNNFTDVRSLNQDTSYTTFADKNPYLINLINIGPDIFSAFVQKKGAHYFRDRYNIAYWNWELSTFPKEWETAFQFVDEIWTPSNFTLDAISRVAPLPVVRMPHSLPANLQTTNRRRSFFGLPKDRFIFLFIFDFESHLERKNPVGVINAFRKAFPRKKDVLLVLKSSHSSANPASLQAVTEASAGARVTIVDRVLSREETNTLISLSDCYVSLHRSEGFGLTIAEAMSLEKPVIATGYSSNMDFMTPWNSFLVKYGTTEIERSHGPYKKGSVWADPDLDHAAELMRFVYDNQAHATEVGRKARQDILHILHPQVVGAMMKRRLEALLHDADN